MSWPSVPGIKEQLCILGLVNELTGGVDVALADEDRIGIHPVYLHRHPSGQEPNAETAAQE